MDNPTIFELIHLMEKVNNKMLLDWKRRFKEDIGISHILLLNFLRENGKSMPTDIAKHLEFAPASITHLSRKLIDKNFCIRVADESDGRISYLKITDLGEAALDSAENEGSEMRKHFLSVLSDEDQRQLLEIYGKLL